MARSILFDLDGTLTDSGEGIINCATLALEYFGLPIPDRQTMRVFVGPPLRDTFYKFGVPKDQLDKAVEVYRSRYIPIGIYENVPYSGIRELLEKLQKAGHRLFVATSKPEWMAEKVLEKFELAEYFTRICGATMDGSRDEKSAVIAYLRESQALDDPIMVGDTAFDVTGAAEHGIPTVGVSWGYGKAEDLQSAGAVAIVHTAEELYDFLSK